LIDLHMHTTASDGRLTPAALVARASAAGLTTIAVTDHDTTAAVDEVTDLATASGIRNIPGIEITAVDQERDVHMLGYFLDHRSVALARFLERQRGFRSDRIRQMGAKLAALGLPVDVEALLESAAREPGTAIGRPWLARGLLDAGHVTSIADAFERFLGSGRQAFVPRTGSSPFEVVAVVHEAGGIVSFAHPGVTRRDWLLAPLAEAGLDAIEVHHSDHPPEARERYATVARELGLAVSGGSDFHGYGETRATLGAVTLPADEFERLSALAADRRAGR
jgi:predicted metal-dependent phosphoesterase TrpH